MNYIGLGLKSKCMRASGCPSIQGIARIHTYITLAYTYTYTYTYTYMTTVAFA
jgi:hypothetical protein